MSVGSGIAPTNWTLGTVETILRVSVAAIGTALFVIAFWRLNTDVGFERVTAVLGSTATQWILVLVFGGFLIVAALRQRSTASEWY